MYSRFPRSSDRPIRLPEHYSGCAFSASPPSMPPSERPPIPVPFSPASPEPEERRDDDIAEEENKAVPPPPGGSGPAPEAERKKDEHPPFVPSVLPEGLRSLFGGRLPAFPGGMAFDELLLLGLILLLSHNDQQSDVILWLALLLFCK